ncbi:MAG: F0F1 ATP synthase subunit B [Bacteroidota bacterium]
MDLVTPGLGLLFWQSMVFLLLLFVLGKFAWKPIMAGLHEREASIDAALKSAEKARHEMQALSNENEKLLAEARKERDRILLDATAAAAAIVAEARNEAGKKAAADLEAARQTIRTEKNAAVAELRNTVATLSLEIAGKVLRKDLSTDQSQKDLVATYLQSAKLS